MSGYSLAVSEQAEEDLAEAALWYEKRGPNLGIDLVKRTREAIAKITESPLIYPLVHGDLRRAGVSDFPTVYSFE